MPLRDRRPPAPCSHRPFFLAFPRIAGAELRTPHAWLDRWVNRLCRLRPAGSLDWAENFRPVRACPYARCGSERAFPSPQEMNPVYGKSCRQRALERGRLPLQLRDMGVSALSLARGALDELEEFPQVFFFHQ